MADDVDHDVSAAGTPSHDLASGRLRVRLLGGHLDVADVAELPELLRSTGLLEQHLVDVKCVQFAAAEPVAA